MDETTRKQIAEKSAHYVILELHTAIAKLISALFPQSKTLKQNVINAYHTQALYINEMAYDD